MPEAITIAVPNDACLNKCTVARHRYRAIVVVTQVEVALQEQSGFMHDC